MKYSDLVRDIVLSKYISRCDTRLLRFGDVASPGGQDGVAIVSFAIFG